MTALPTPSTDVEAAFLSLASDTRANGLPASRKLRLAQKAAAHHPLPKTWEGGMAEVYRAAELAAAKFRRDNGQPGGAAS